MDLIDFEQSISNQVTVPRPFYGPRSLSVCLQFPVICLSGYLHSVSLLAWIFNNYVALTLFTVNRKAHPMEPSNQALWLRHEEWHRLKDITQNFKPRPIPIISFGMGLCAAKVQHHTSLHAPPIFSCSTEKSRCWPTRDENYSCQVGSGWLFA